MINYKRKENISREIKIAKASDNNLCKKVLEDEKIMNNIYQFLISNPYANSAELNSFLIKFNNTNNQIEVYFTSA